jgi:TRAP-type C4-dicarboxylate transport system permease small subunit
MKALRKIVTLIGGIALVSATGIDVLSVIGRHVGLPFRGSIELVQVAVLVAGTLALLVATVDRSHAKVHLLVDRMGDGARDVLDRVSALLGAVFFAALLAGSVWLMADLWSGHEQSEVIGVSWRAMRIFANVVLAVIVLALLGQVFRRQRP